MGAPAATLASACNSRRRLPSSTILLRVQLLRVQPLCLQKVGVLALLLQTRIPRAKRLKPQECREHLTGSNLTDTGAVQCWETFSSPGFRYGRHVSRHFFICCGEWPTYLKYKNGGFPSCIWGQTLQTHLRRRNHSTVDIPARTKDHAPCASKTTPFTQKARYTLHTRVGASKRVPGCSPVACRGARRTQ